MTTQIKNEPGLVDYLFVGLRWKPISFFHFHEGRALERPPTIAIVYVILYKTM